MEMPGGAFGHTLLSKSTPLMHCVACAIRGVHFCGPVKHAVLHHVSEMQFKWL